MASVSDFGSTDEGGDFRHMNLKEKPFSTLVGIKSSLPRHQNLTFADFIDTFPMMKQFIVQTSETGLYLSSGKIILHGGM